MSIEKLFNVDKDGNGGLSKKKKMVTVETGEVYDEQRVR